MSFEIDTHGWANFARTYFLDKNRSPPPAPNLQAIWPVRLTPKGKQRTELYSLRVTWGQFV